MSESARKTTGIIRVREKSKPHDISELKPISYWISKNSPGVDVSKIKKIVWTKTKISEYNYEYNFIIFLIDGNAIFFSVTKTYTDDVEFIDYHNNNVDIFEPLYSTKQFSVSNLNNLIGVLSKLFVYAVDHKNKDETEKDASKVINKFLKNSAIETLRELSLRPPRTLSEQDPGGSAYLNALSTTKIGKKAVEKKGGKQYTKRRIRKTSRSKTSRSKT